MRKAIFIVLACVLFIPVTAQFRYDEINSSRLNTVRKLKIKLPEDYDQASDKKYPLIIVFDGDYLFEPVVGQVGFQTYINEMPGSIVVGIVQGNERLYDAFSDDITGLPIESGLRFHEFILEELIPYLDNNYNTSTYRIAVGHDFMGNFINSYLFKENPIFQAYVCISPDLVGDVRAYIAERLQYFKQDLFYYMATSDNDIPNIRTSVLDVNSELSQINNSHLTYYFDDFKDETHYTLVTSAITKAFDKIFDLYKPLSQEKLNEEVFKFEGTLDKYLVDRHARIEERFGVNKPINDEEIEKVVQVAEARNDLESLQKIGKLANKLNPKSLLGTYYLAQYSEKMGKTKKAKKLYESALTLNDVSHIDRDYIFSKIDELTVVDTKDHEEDDNEEEK